MIGRRDLLALLGAAAVAPRAVLAQSKQAPVLIGWLNTGGQNTQGHFLAAFKEGLAALGWREGAQVEIEVRWADGRNERLPALARELAAKKPAVIVAAPNAPVVAAAKAAPNTPIVQASGSDPVAAGYAASLAHPGGTITGLSNIVGDVSEKYLELLLAAAPKLRRVGFVIDASLPPAVHAAFLEAARRSVARHSVEERFADVARPEDIEPAMARLAKEGVQGLVVTPSAVFTTERRRIVKLALAYRWPTIAGPYEFTEDGALLSYGIDITANYRRAAYYVDRILKGAKPGDLPIEQPTRFELVINNKTAKALGIGIPQSMLLRADKVME